MALILYSMDLTWASGNPVWATHTHSVQPRKLSARGMSETLAKRWADVFFDYGTTINGDMLFYDGVVDPSIC
jgi:hypothetical protein